MIFRKYKNSQTITIFKPFQQKKGILLSFGNEIIYKVGNKSLKNAILGQVKGISLSD